MKFSWCSGYHICLTHRRSPVRSRAKTNLLSDQKSGKAGKTLEHIFLWVTCSKKWTERLFYFRTFPFNLYAMQYTTDRINFWYLTIFTCIFSFVFYFHEIKTANVIYVLLHYWQTENLRRKISHLPLGADQLGGNPYTQWN